MGALIGEYGGGFTGDAGILAFSRAFLAIIGAGSMQKCRLCRFNKKPQVVHDCVLVFYLAGVTN